MLSQRGAALLRMILLTAFAYSVCGCLEVISVLQFGKQSRRVHTIGLSLTEDPSGAWPGCSSRAQMMHLERV